MTETATIQRWREGPRPEEVLAWERCGTLTDLGRVVARWLDGDFCWYPGYLAPGPATETFTTPGMMEALVALNRAGLVTEDSQAGVTTDEVRQRAYVCGFGSPERVRVLERELSGSELVLLVLEPAMRGRLGPEEHNWVSLAVTMWGSAPCTYLGRGYTPDERIDRYLPASPLLAKPLGGTVEFHLCDPVWGRNDVLWPALLSVVRQLVTESARSGVSVLTDA